MGAARKARSASGGSAGKGARGQTVTLVRGAHRWTFSCGPGDESALMDAIAEVTSRPGSDIDRFDMAIVGQQLARGRGGAAPAGEGGKAAKFLSDPPPPATPPPPMAA